MAHQRPRWKRTYNATIFMVGLAIACLLIHLHKRPESARGSGRLVQWTRDMFGNLQFTFWLLAFQFVLLTGVFEAIRVRSTREDVKLRPIRSAAPRCDRATRPDVR